MIYCCPFFKRCKVPTVWLAIVACSTSAVSVTKRRSRDIVGSRSCSLRERRVLLGSLGSKEESTYIRRWYCRWWWLHRDNTACDNILGGAGSLGGGTRYRQYRICSWYSAGNKEGLTVPISKPLERLYSRRIHVSISSRGLSIGFLRFDNVLHSSERLLESTVKRRRGPWPSGLSRLESLPGSAWFTMLFALIRSLFWDRWKSRVYPARRIVIENSSYSSLITVIGRNLL